MKNAGLETEAKVGRIDEACKRYSVGHHTMRALASDANAVIWIGRCLLINFDKVDRYLDLLSDK